MYRFSSHSLPLLIPQTLTPYPLPPSQLTPILPSMAIPTSSYFSLACIYCGDKTQKLNSFNYNPTFKQNPQTQLSLNSSNYPSPILEEDESTDFELKKKLQDFQVSTISNDQEDLNVLICRLFKNSETEDMGFEYYQKAKSRVDFKPQKSTLKLLIRYTSRLKNWTFIWSLSEDFRTFNVYPDGSTCSRLISSCIRARKFKLVNKLLSVLKFEKETVSAFNAALKGYNKLHMYSSSASVFAILKSSKVVLDDECYGRVMEAYMKMGRNEKVVSLFEEFKSSGIAWTSFCTQIYWILCESLGKLRRPSEALEFFREMTGKGFPEDPSFYSSLICAFASVKELKMAETLMEEAEGKKMLRDPAVFLKVVLMYIELGRVEKSLDVVSAMKRVNIRISDCIFCAIVNGFSKKRGLNSAAKVYEDLISEGCEPGQVTYASVVNVYCQIGLYSKAEEIFWEMDNKGFDKCVVAYASMIAMYGRTNQIRDAMRLVARMKEKGVEPNVWIYNSLLDMHGKVLNLRQVEKIWKEMKRRRVVPDKVSYTSVISAYSKAREYDMSMQYYNEYRLNGGRIDRVMGGIMVGVYSKISRVDELVKLLQDMKEEGTSLDIRLYRSSLNALRDAGLQFQAKWLQESFETM